MALVERLLDLRRHVDHLREIRPRVTGADALRRDLTLHNDVLFSLLRVCQSVIGMAAELSVRRGERFEDYTEVVRSLAHDLRFPETLVNRLEWLPEFRNIALESVPRDFDRVVAALQDLGPIEEFLRIARDVVAESADG